uniref:Conotoxin Im9.1 n=1 Tax=Conus imperialis TaxID=35631 RepID=CM91_CONIM|nr:RecName: Full=Conotoxin Im9.1; AltName: Full=Conopeptide im015; Flags: Precursor [Conus imperialis]AME17673.1 conopeptide im015 [Conus imperialis]
MSKVGVVPLIFLVLLSIAALQNGDDPRRQRDEKQSPQGDILRSTLTKYSYNIQRRCWAGGSPCHLCSSSQVCIAPTGHPAIMCGRCVPILT